MNLGRVVGNPFQLPGAWPWHPSAPLLCRSPGLCAIIHYLIRGQLGWFGLTVACVVPGYAAQLLSILWFRADGRLPDRWLLVLHLLQLGLWKR